MVALIQIQAENNLNLMPDTSHCALTVLSLLSVQIHRSRQGGQRTGGQCSTAGQEPCNIPSAVWGPDIPAPGTWRNHNAQVSRILYLYRPRITHLHKLLHICVRTHTHTHTHTHTNSMHRWMSAIEYLKNWRQKNSVTVPGAEPIWQSQQILA